MNKHYTFFFEQSKITSINQEERVYHYLAMKLHDEFWTNKVTISAYYKTTPKLYKGDSSSHYTSTILPLPA
jgi:hypothetical protein